MKVYGMTTIQPFEGFPKEGINFLKDLKENNNRNWFNANKKIYTESLLSPAQSFVSELGEKLSNALVDIRYDTKATGSGSIMRIYRDIRFSKDKTPYRTRLGLIFWEGPGKKMQHPGFHIGISPDMATIHGGMYHFSKEIIPKYRDAVVANDTGVRLEKILAKLKKTGYKIGGVHYKRIPRGYESEHERADLLLHNGLYAEYSKIPRKLLSSPELVDHCLEHCIAMSSLHNWLVERDQA